MSRLAISSGDRFCVSRKGGSGGGGWAHTKGAESMVMSGLGIEKSPWLDGPYLSCLHKWAEKTVLSPCRASISGSEALFPVYMGSG